MRLIEPTIKFKENFMAWFDKFKVGQEVKVVRKIDSWRAYGGLGVSWNSDMDKTIGKAYKIVYIDKHCGYQLQTEKDTYHEYNYWYPVESLAYVKGKQLLFNFMN